MSIYEFNVIDRTGSDVSLSQYEGKVLLIVNTATECGFTPHYEDLQALYNEFQKDGLEILDFPCNQFGAQAPGSNEEIHTFCTSRYGVTFPQFDKIDVNGEHAIPLYQYLTANTKFEGFEKNPMGYYTSYYAYVKGFDNEYTLNVNGKSICIVKDMRKNF